MVRYAVGREVDLREASQSVVEVEGKSVGVFFKGGEWFALRNRCPHQGAELCRGIVAGTVLLSDANEPVYAMEGPGAQVPVARFRV